MGPGPAQPGAGRGPGAPPPEPGEPGYLRHRPQCQLHQYLRFGLPLLRLLPGGRGPGRLRPGLGEPGGEAAGAQGPRRQRGLAPGRSQPRPAPQLLREAGELHPGLRPGGPRLFAAGNLLFGQAERLEPGGDHPAFAGRGPEFHPGGRRRNPGGSGAPAHLPQQMRQPPSGWRSWQPPSGWA